MDVEIRHEQLQDHRIVEALVREAFWNVHCPGCDEHYLLHTMRDSPLFVTELSFVAVCKNLIVGHIAYARAKISRDDGSEAEALCLGPISVLPEFQSKGIGGKLIDHTKRLAQKIGYSAIFLYGDPAYYSRHGFIPAKQLNIRTEDNMYAAALQACVLNKAESTNVGGRFLEGDIYKIDESLSADFDKGFPAKEKKSGTYSQKRFEEIVAMKEAFR